MARVYLKGLPQLKAKLQKLRADTAPAVMPALSNAASKIVAMMRRQVPVDDGTLRDSIGWTWGDAPEGALKLVTAKAGQATITIYAGSREAYYARWVEFGTSPHAVGKGSDVSAGRRKQSGAMHPGHRARPFFFTSYRALRRETKLAIRRAISEAVMRAKR